MTYKSIEITVVITASILQTVDVQMMFPAQQAMYMMPAPPPMAVQVMPPPPPVGVPVPYPVPVPVMVSKRTTTTTTEAPSREEKEENNMMVIGGNPFAPPIIVMPVPPSNVRRVEYDETSKSESSSDDSSDSSDSSRSALRTRKHRQHHSLRKGPRRKQHLRANGRGQKHHENHQKISRNKRNLGFGDPNFIRPVLTYLSKRGNVKFKTKISGDDAARLIGMKKMHTDVESSDTSQSHPPREISGLRLIQNTEETRGIGTLPDKSDPLRKSAAQNSSTVNGNVLKLGTDM